jgi:hypothetical protein
VEEGVVARDVRAGYKDPHLPTPGNNLGNIPLTCITQPTGTYTVIPLIYKYI